MRRLIVLGVIVVTAACSTAHAAQSVGTRHHRRAVVNVWRLPSSTSWRDPRAAQWPSLVMRPLRPVIDLEPSFFSVHAARVAHDMIYFAPEIPVGDLPAAPNKLMLMAPTKAPLGGFNYAQTPPAQDLLEVYRERDRLLLWEPPENSGAGLGEGIGLFVAATLLSAHLPRPLRFVVDKRVHLGPSIFSDGGMGAGIGGQWN